MMNFLLTLKNSTQQTPILSLYLIVIALITVPLLSFFIFKLVKPRKANTSHSKIDFETIAGDDVIMTQLDLARAYLEMDKKPFALKILNDVIKHGNTIQKNEAKRLLVDAKL